MSERAERLPAAPSGVGVVGVTGLTASLRRGTTVYRIHWEDDPLAPRDHPPRARFDLPGVPVTYANGTLAGAIGEVYGDRRRIPADHAGRLASAIRVRRAGVRCAPLDGPGLQKALNVDGRVCTSRDYERTRTYAAAIRRGLPEVAAIRYVARHAGAERRERNWCLFLDRFGPDELELRRLGTLGALRREVLRAADRYRLVSELAA